MQEIQKGKNSQENDRTFTYIYRHPNSYEPLAQCIDRRDEQGNRIEHEINYFHCDQIGIPREMTDSQGKLIWCGRYDAWGGLHYDRRLAQENQGHQPFRLQNQYLDQETGLHYNFLRYYEPMTGRFITQDPIGLAGGNNLYRFEGTVQNQIDPLGLFAPALTPAVPWILEGLAYVGTAVAGILIAAGIMDAKEEHDKAQSSAQTKSENTSKCDKKQCPPCKPYPVGTIGYQGPKKSVHGMHGTRNGTGEMHYILFEVQQNPPHKDCTCRWQESKKIAGHHYMYQPNIFLTVNLNGRERPPSYP
ncbi:RHS repeat domain-containing protein [Rodentibacter caecimuris]|uniref:RHS repeat domain-containing protein n=1 Tax=Rodentibacter caecimuris TaxID=1796644 RepID=UPI001F1B12F6|nr:RHS repeat-associated core domain-containing protein [Rodentibacter heylii]